LTLGKKTDSDLEPSGRASRKPKLAISRKESQQQVPKADAGQREREEKRRRDRVYFGK